jgi:hypothetical protein
MTTKKTKKETEIKAPKVATSQPITQTQTQTPPPQPTTDLTIADLRNLGTIIDVASSRGAFRANEMATVGLMYNKLQSFLAKVAPETKPEEKQTTQTTTAATTTGK